MKTWVYVLDEFRPVDVEEKRLLEIVEEDPLKLFEAIREVLASDIKEIRSVRVYDVYFNPSNSELLVEYLVKSELGEISVKFIYSDSPSQTLLNYYKYETEKRR